MPTNWDEIAQQELGAPTEEPQTTDWDAIAAAEGITAPEDITAPTGIMPPPEDRAPWMLLGPSGSEAPIRGTYITGLQGQTMGEMVHGNEITINDLLAPENVRNVNAADVVTYGDLLSPENLRYREPGNQVALGDLIDVNSLPRVQPNAQTAGRQFLGEFQPTGRAASGSSGGAPTPVTPAQTTPANEWRLEYPVGPTAPGGVNAGEELAKALAEPVANAVRTYQRSATDIGERIARGDVLGAAGATVSGLGQLAGDIVGGYLGLLGKPAQLVEQGLGRYEMGNVTLSDDYVNSIWAGRGAEDVQKRQDALAALPPERHNQIIDILSRMTYSGAQRQMAALDDLLNQGANWSKQDWDQVKRDMQERGVGREEAINQHTIDKHSDPWSEMAGQSIYDPLWLMPAPIAEKVFAPINKPIEVGFGLLKSGASKVFGKIPWTKGAEAAKAATVFGDEAHTALGEFFGAKRPEEDWFAKLGRAMTGSFDATLSDKSKRTMQQITGMMRQYNPTHPDDIGGTLNRILKIYDPANGGRLFKDTPPEVIADSIQKAAINAYRKGAGLTPIDTAPGLIQRSLNWMGQFLTESWLADFSVAYNLSNTLGDTTRNLLTHHYLNPLDWKASERVQGLLASVGYAVPRQMERAQFTSLLGEKATGALNAAERTPIPFIGKPSSFANLLRDLTGVDLAKSGGRVTRALFSEAELSESRVIQALRNLNLGGWRRLNRNLTNNLEQAMRFSMFEAEVSPLLTRARASVADMIERTAGVAPGVAREIAGQLRGLIRTPEDLAKHVRELATPMVPRARTWSYSAGQPVSEGLTSFLQDVAASLKKLGNATPEQVAKVFADAREQAQQLLKRAAAMQKNSALAQKQAATAQALAMTAGHDGNLLARFNAKLTELRQGYGTVTDGFLRRMETALTWTQYAEFTRGVTRERGKFLTAFRTEQAKIPAQDRIDLSWIDLRNLSDWPQEMKTAYDAYLRQRLTARKIQVPFPQDLAIVRDTVADIQTRAAADWGNLISGHFPMRASRANERTARAVALDLLQADYNLHILTDGQVHLDTSGWERASKEALDQVQAKAKGVQLPKATPAEAASTRPAFTDVLAGMVNKETGTMKRGGDYIRELAGQRTTQELTDALRWATAPEQSRFVNRFTAGNIADVLKTRGVDPNKLAQEFKLERMGLKEQASQAVAGNRAKPVLAPGTLAEHTADGRTVSLRKTDDGFGIFIQTKDAATGENIVNRVGTFDATPSGEQLAKQSYETLTGATAPRKVSATETRLLGQIAREKAAKGAKAGSAAQEAARIAQSNSLSDAEWEKVTGQRTIPGAPGAAASAAVPPPPGQSGGTLADNAQAVTAWTTDVLNEVNRVLDEWERQALNQMAQAAAQPVRTPVKIPQATIDAWTRALANAYREAIDQGTRIVNDNLFDYGLRGGFENLLGKATPFFKYQLSMIPWSARAMEQRPALAATVGRYGQASGLDVQQRGLPPRYAGTFPVPQPLADARSAAWNATLGNTFGKLPTGVSVRANPIGFLTPFALGALTDVREPYLTAKGNTVVNPQGDVVQTFATPAEAAQYVDDQAKGFSAETSGAVRALRGIVDIMGAAGMRPWPPIQAVLYRAGAYGDQYPADLLPETTAVKALTGRDVEQPLKNLETGQTGDPTVQFYTALEISKQVQSGALPLSAAMQALAHPDTDSNWLAAQEKIVREQGTQGMVRKFEPLSVRGVDPQEMQLRATADQLGTLFDALDQARQANDLPAIEAAKAAVTQFYAAHPEMTAWGTRSKTPTEADVRMQTDALIAADRQAVQERDAALATLAQRTPLGQKRTEEQNAIWDRYQAQIAQNQARYPNVSFASTAIKAPVELEQQEQEAALRVVTQLEPTWGDGSQWGKDYTRFQTAHDEWASDPNAVLDRYFAGSASEQRPGASLTAAQVTAYKQANDTADQALESAYAQWSGERMDALMSTGAPSEARFLQAGGQGTYAPTSKERAAERVVLEGVYGQQPTVDELIARVRAQYGDKFDPAELRSRIQERGMLTATAKEQAGQTTEERTTTEIYDLLGRIPAGKTNGAQDAINAEMVRRGFPEKDYVGLFYDAAKGLKPEVLTALRDAATTVTAQRQWQPKTVQDLRAEIQAGKDWDTWNAMPERTVAERQAKQAYFDARLQPLYGEPDTAKARAWQTYYNVLPPGRAADALRTDPRVAAFLDADFRGTWDDATYAYVDRVMMKWVIDHRDELGDPRYYKAARDTRDLFREKQPASIDDVQTGYYDLPANQRRAYLQEHPELQTYWDNLHAWEKDPANKVAVWFYYPDVYKQQYGDAKPTADWNASGKPPTTPQPAAGAQVQAPTRLPSSAPGQGRGGPGYSGGSTYRSTSAAQSAAMWNDLQSQLTVTNPGLAQEISGYFAQAPSQRSIYAMSKPALAQWLTGKSAAYMAQLEAAYLAYIKSLLGPTRTQSTYVKVLPSTRYIKRY